MPEWLFLPVPPFAGGRIFREGAVLRPRRSCRVGGELRRSGLVFSSNVLCPKKNNKNDGENSEVMGICSRRGHRKSILSASVEIWQLVDVVGEIIMKWIGQIWIYSILFLHLFPRAHLFQICVFDCLLVISACRFHNHVPVLVFISITTPPARPDLSQGIKALLGQWPSQKSTNYPGPTLKHPSSQSSSISQSMFKAKITRSYGESESEGSTSRLLPLRTDCLVLFSIAPSSLIPLVKTIPIKQSYCMSNPGPSCCVIVIWSCYFLI